MACSICGGEGHNRRTCGRGSYTPTPPPAWSSTPLPPVPMYGPPPQAFNPNAFAPPRRASATSPALIALLVLVGVCVSGLGGCMLCLCAASVPGRTTAAAPERAPSPPAVARPTAPGIRVEPPVAAQTPKPPTRAPAAAPAPAPAPAPRPASAGGGGGTRAMCCDGSLSPSCGCGGGRGCCSRHGGVCGCQ